MFYFIVLKPKKHVLFKKNICFKTSSSSINDLGIDDSVLCPEDSMMVMMMMMMMMKITDPPKNIRFFWPTLYLFIYL